MEWNSLPVSFPKDSCFSVFLKPFCYSPSTSKNKMCSIPTGSDPFAPPFLTPSYHLSPFLSLKSWPADLHVPFELHFSIPDPPNRVMWKRSIWRKIKHRFPIWKPMSYFLFYFILFYSYLKYTLQSGLERKCSCALKGISCCESAEYCPSLYKHDAEELWPQMLPVLHVGHVHVGCGCITVH